MNTTSSPKYTVVSPDETILNLIKKISREHSITFGIAFVLSDERRLLGVINYADILRSLDVTEGDLDLKVSDIMITNYISVTSDLSDYEIENPYVGRCTLKLVDSKSSLGICPVLSDELSLIDVVDMLELFSKSSQDSRFVQVYGLGFVGLTLAVSLANSGHFVRGIDINQDLIAQLQSGEPHIYEPRLKDMLQLSLKNKTLELEAFADDKHYPVHIISVGTPLVTILLTSPILN